MKILFLGDIVGDSGCDAIIKNLQREIKSGISQYPLEVKFLDIFFICIIFIMFNTSMDKPAEQKIKRF